MKTIQFLLLSITLFIVGNCLFSATTLQILEPRINQHTEKGSIQDMTVYIKPQGTYSEVNVFISFNSEGSGWRDITDTLEIAMNFWLDPKAMITDSYLYMDDGEKVQALIIDVWSATKIYEGYVKRRTDPSIIRKKSINSYELRIFPLAGSLSRKAQINFQVPNNIMLNTDEIYLPFEWLKASYELPENVTLYFVQNTEFSEPSVNPSNESVVFSQVIDPDYGPALKADIPSDIAKNLNSLTVKTKLSSENFLTVENYDDKQYYQLSIPLKSSYKEVPRQNTCFVLDYEEGKANQNLNDVISALKSSIINYSMPGDSFNIILSGFKPIAVSNKWLHADSATINQAFTNVNSSSVSTVTHLFEAVDKAMDFINTNGKKAVVYIVSNSDAYGDNNVANEFIDHIFSNYETDISISVYSFCNEYKCRSYTMGGMTFKANDYLYLNLVKLSKGSSFYKTENNESPNTSFNNAMPEVMGAFDNFMIYTILDDGYVYNKYLFSDKLGANSRYVEFGMVSGSLPMTIDIGYTFRSKFLNKKVKINSEDVSKEYYNTHVLWAGNMIAAKEKQPQTNNTVYQIIDESMSNRVLSIYTAFLALEKNAKDTIPSDPEEQDDDWTTYVTDMNGVKLGINPNPIVNNGIIDISIPESITLSSSSLVLYDIFGREVMRFDINKTGLHEIRIPWDGIDNNGNILPNGVYMMVLQIGNNRTSMKVVIAR